MLQIFTFFILLIFSHSLLAKDNLKNIILASSNALEALPSEDKKNEWRLEYFTTDLAITVDGRFGIFAGRGSPSTQLYWRKQGTPNPKEHESVHESFHPSLKSDETHLEDIEHSLEALFIPYLKKELKSKAEKDRWHDAVHQIAIKTFEVIQSFEEIPLNEDTPWRFSGLRFEYTINAGGFPLPFGTIGLDTRVRLDWKLRLKQKHRSTAHHAPFFEDAKKLANNFQVLLHNLDGQLTKKKLMAYAFRVGLGISARGEMGVARLSTQAQFHLLYSRGIERPVVYPKNHHTLDETKSVDGNVITAKQWQKGLERSIKLSEKISKIARPLLTKKKWKLYLIKMGLDFNLNSDIGDYTLGGQLLSEVSFYNMNF